MRAAEVSASRGHHVILMERDDRLGGQIRYAAQISTRGRWSVMIDDLQRMLDRYRVDVRLDCPASLATIGSEQPDHVILASGSSWRTDGFSAMLGFRPGIPGLEHTVVLDPITAITSPDRVGSRVVIVDETGEYLPLGLAETLAGRGITVEVVSTKMFLGDNIVLTLDIPHLYPRLHAAGVTLSPQHAVMEVTPAGAVLCRIWDGAARVVPIDSLITVMMRDVNDALLESLQAEFPVSQIGDCLAPRTVDEAIYEGEIAGRAV